MLANRIGVGCQLLLSWAAERLHTAVTGPRPLKGTLYLFKTFLKTEMCFQLSPFVELPFLEGLPHLGQSRMTIPVVIDD